MITNEQLDVLYDVEKWLLLVETMENSKGNDEALEKLTQVIRELDPSSGFNQGTEDEKGEET
jgi:hypothetical protein